MPRFNIAPTQDVLGLVEGPGGLRIEPFHWGLIPAWSPTPSTKLSTFNARLETAATGRIFAKPFAERRCIILASGIFEWKLDETGKQPYFFRPKAGGVVGLAGIWERWSPKAETPVGQGEIFSCSILTTAAQGLMADYHDRMPLFLGRDDWTAWATGGKREPAKSLELLAGRKPVELEAVRISKLVNSSRIDAPEIMKPYP